MLLFFNGVLAGILYTIGGVLFLVLAILNAIESNKPSTIVMYLLGSILYLSGSILFLITSIRQSLKVKSIQTEVGINKQLIQKNAQDIESIVSR